MGPHNRDSGVRRGASKINCLQNACKRGLCVRRGRVGTRRYRFVCRKCGAEYWLQAWKAVCPSCREEFTLEQITGEKEPRGRKAIVSTLLLAGYAALTLAAPSPTGLHTLLPFIPSTAVATLTLVLALFVFLGAEPALWVSTLYGPASLLALALHQTPLALLQAGMGVSVTVSSTLYLLSLRKFKSRLSQPVNARSMPEYSGWAGD